jgi:predicted protein tyrosine phosphatase
MGADRSTTAAELFEDSDDVESRSAGFSPLRDSKKITNQLIRWASKIFVMDEKNEFHKTQLLQRFPDAEDKEIVILDIPYTFTRNDPRLEEILREKLEKHL